MLIKFFCQGFLGFLDNLNFYHQIFYSFRLFILVFSKCFFSLNANLFGYEVGYLAYFRYLIDFVAYSAGYLYKLFNSVLKSLLELLFGAKLYKMIFVDSFSLIYNNLTKFQVYEKSGPSFTEADKIIAIVKDGIKIIVGLLFSYFGSGYINSIFNIFIKVMEIYYYFCIYIYRIIILFIPYFVYKCVKILITIPFIWCFGSSHMQVMISNLDDVRQKLPLLSFTSSSNQKFYPVYRR